MPRFRAILECDDGCRTVFVSFIADLPSGAGGVDIVREGEELARRLGWKSFVVVTNSLGAVLPAPAGTQRLQ